MIKINEIEVKPELLVRSIERPFSDDVDPNHRDPAFVPNLVCPKIDKALGVHHDSISR